MANEMMTARNGSSIRAVVPGLGHGPEPDACSSESSAAAGATWTRDRGIVNGNDGTTRRLRMTVTENHQSDIL
jgi:hypothetical protein